MSKFFILNGDLDAEHDPSCGITLMECDDWEDVYDQLGLDTHEGVEIPSKKTIQVAIGEICDKTTEDATLEIIDPKLVRQAFLNKVASLDWTRPYVLEQAYKFLFNLNEDNGTEGRVVHTPKKS